MKLNCFRVNYQATQYWIFCWWHSVHWLHWVIFRIVLQSARCAFLQLQKIQGRWNNSGWLYFILIFCQYCSKAINTSSIDTWLTFQSFWMKLKLALKLRTQNRVEYRSFHHRKERNRHCSESFMRTSNLEISLCYVLCHHNSVLYSHLSLWVVWFL